MQKLITKLVALSLAIMLIFSANSSAISSLASELTGGGTQANRGIQMPVQALEDEGAQTAESEDLPSQEEISPEDENTTEESSEETEENTSQIESNEEAEDTAEETEQADLVQAMAEEQALGGTIPEEGIDLADGNIVVESATKVTQKISETETKEYAIIAGQEIKITQSNPTEATANTITVGENCATAEGATVNIVLSGVNIVTDCSDTNAITASSDTKISIQGENQLTALIAIYSVSDLTLNGTGTLTATGSYASGISINGKLTIQNCEINAFSGNDCDETTAAIYATSDITIEQANIKAEGTPEDTHADHGIYSSDGNLKIEGGTVTATGTATNSSSPVYGIYALKEVIIDDATVDATGTANSGSGYGISAGRCLTIKNGGTVTAKGATTNSTSPAYGIYALQMVTIDDAIVRATGTGNGSMGIHSVGLVKINGGTVTAKGEVTEKIGDKQVGESYGIYANGSVEINGGEVSATGTIENIAEGGTGYSYGIRATDVAISGGTVNATGTARGNYGYGIIAETNVTISGGTVNATGVTHGISVIVARNEKALIDENETAKIAISGTANVYAKGSTAGIYSEGTVDLSKLNGGTVEAVASKVSDENATTGGIIIFPIKVEPEPTFKSDATSDNIAFPTYKYIFYENTEEPTVVDSRYIVQNIGFNRKQVGTSSYDVSKSYVKVDPAVTISYQAAENGKVSTASETVGKTSAAIGSTATANEGYKFTGWYDENGNQVATDASFVPVKQGEGRFASFLSATYTAKFEKENTPLLGGENTDLSSTSASTQTGQDMTTLYFSLALAVVAIIASVILYKKKKA